MMIQLDLSKAYDSLSWSYLVSILNSLGFEKRWVSWIFSLISSPVYSILLNGSPSKTFNPSRGLRQGDPISPFIFILVVEGLGRYFKSTVLSSQIKGLPPWGNDISITQQQFVDDIMQ